MIELRAGALRLALRPDLGGCIAGFWHGEHAVMRSTEAAELPRVRLAGSYPLLPYSNRIGFRRVPWLGREVELAPNVGDEMPHALHGTTWQQPWTVAEASATRAVLRQHHEANALWPWSFDAEQVFELSETTLRLELALTSRATEPQPVGLGWHPYFPKRPGSRVEVSLSQRWDNDAHHLAYRRVPQAPLQAAVAELDVDNCYEGWPGEARFSDEAVDVALRSDLPYLVVFTPPNKPYFCIEPVSHVSNAVQQADAAAHGVRSVGPGETTRGWMSLEVRPQAGA